MAEMMLQRTRAEQVVPVWLEFTRRWPTLDLARAAADAELKEVLRPLGLEWRLQNIVRLLRSVECLDSPANLRGIPGIGHYIDAAVRCFAFHEPTAVVDVNVVRFYSMVFDFAFADNIRRESKFHQFARSLLPDDRFREYNWGIIDIGNELRTKKIITDSVWRRNP